MVFEFDLKSCATINTHGDRNVSNYQAMSSIRFCSQVYIVLPIYSSLNIYLSFRQLPSSVVTQIIVYQKLVLVVKCTLNPSKADIP